MGLKELRARALKVTKERVREAKFRRDHLIVHAVNAIDELDEIVNLMTERVRNWYALHYPELEKLVRSPDAYLGILKEAANRKRMTEAGLSRFVPQDTARKVSDIARQTLGAEVADEDLEEISAMASTTLSAMQERERLAQYVDKATSQICPNVHSLAGGMLAGRLLAKAGSLERLAEFPASTVQVLGAEKALFAHIRKGVKPPKHGVLFAHPAVQQAPRQLKGRISRLLANKLSIAAKMDFFGHGLEPALKRALDAQVARAMAAPIKEKPPQQFKPQPRPQGGRPQQGPQGFKPKPQGEGFKGGRK
jgi:nucleolar protein 56